MAQDDNTSGATSIFVGREQASMKRRSPQHTEELFAHARGCQVIRIAAGEVEIEREGIGDRERLKRVGSRQPVESIPRRHVEPIRAGRAILLPDRHDAVRIGDRQRAQEQGVGDADNRDRGADSNGKHQQRDRREGGRLGERARAVDDIMNEFGIEGELPSYPRRIRKRAKCARDQVHVGAPRVTPSTMEGRGVMGQLGFPLVSPADPPRRRDHERDRPDHPERKSQSERRRHDDRAGRSRRARAAIDRGTS
jgi:hypothetical protein